MNVINTPGPHKKPPPTGVIDLARYLIYDENGSLRWTSEDWTWKSRTLSLVFRGSAEKAKIHAACARLECLNWMAPTVTATVNRWQAWIPSKRLSSNYKTGPDRRQPGAFTYYAPTHECETSLLGHLWHLRLAENPDSINFSISKLIRSIDDSRKVSILRSPFPFNCSTYNITKRFFEWSSINLSLQLFRLQLLPSISYHRATILPSWKSLGRACSAW